MIASKPICQGSNPCTDAKIKCGKSKIEKQNLNGASLMSLLNEQMLVNKKFITPL
jgi:hypothetical protein